MASTIYSASSGGAGSANLAGNFQAIGKQARIIADSVGEIGRSLNPGGQSLRQMLDSLGLQGLPLPSLKNARTCALPSCDCPSPDLGELRHVVDKSGPVQIAVRFRNTTKKARTFNLTGSELIDPSGNVVSKLAVEPGQVTLEPGQGQVVQIIAGVKELQPGGDYTGSVRIAAENCETMYLGIIIRLQPEVERVPVIDLHCCCTPKVRPLKWYHHYYCDPPARERTSDNNDNNNIRSVG